MTSAFRATWVEALMGTRGSDAGVTPLMALPSHTPTWLGRGMRLALSLPVWSCLYFPLQPQGQELLAWSRSFTPPSHTPPPPPQTHRDRMKGGGRQERGADEEEKITGLEVGASPFLGAHLPKYLLS